MASIITIILGISYVVGVFILHGFALSVLRSWFISPYFGIHEIGIAQAIISD